ncbi:MAG: protease Do [Actinomycetia bacterium]|nr:protease Do [Actinomycetes bacterium]
MTDEPEAPVEPEPVAATPARPKRAGKVAAATVAALAFASAGFTAGRTTSPPSAAVTPTAAVSAVKTAPAVAGSSDPAAAAAAAVSAAVVQIETSDGLGSGVLYDAQGHILTAAHVVTGSSTVTVRLSDGTTLQGQVVGADDTTDVAVVKVTPPADITPATLATGEDLQVGQLAVAIGSPFGLDQTVTSGIVSAVDRSVQGMTVVQTDAAINPGNSGGPLVDADGHVIGINDSIYSDSGDNAGVGFAIPVDIAARVAQELVSGGAVDLARLGVSTTEPTSGQGGALVGQVEPGSAADAAGIAVGDLITSVDGTPVTGSSKLQALILRHAPGDRVGLEIVRDGGSKSVVATLGSVASASSAR